MLRRRELDAPDPFEEMCHQSFDRMSASLRGKNDADIQTALISFQKTMNIYPGLLFWILTEAEAPDKLFQHVRNVTVDNFVAFCSMLQVVCEKKFPLLNNSSLKKVLFLVDELVGLDISAIDSPLASLCRQIPSGSSSPKTLANLSQIFNIIRKHRSIIATRSQLLSSIMYHFVRILPELAAEQKLLTNIGGFLCQLISDYPNEWQTLGRDAVRVLAVSMNVYHPFKAYYDSSLPMLDKQTPALFLQSRLTPDMEEKIKFVLSEVQLGSQQRYLTWFMTKFIRNADSIVFDLVRYLCSVGRQKLPSWAILGWLFKTYQQSSLISQISRCILYDFMFYRPNDDQQRLEPGFLLMLNSVRGYQDITQLLLESLIECTQNFQPPSLCTQVRSSIELSLMKAATVAGLQSLSPLFVNPNLRNTLSTSFPKAFSASIQTAPSPASPTLKRAPSPSSTSPPAKSAKVVSDSQSMLSGILNRIPSSLKEVFSNLFVLMYNNEPADDPEHEISTAMSSIINYITSSDVRDDVAQQIISSLAELLKRQLCTGIFRASRVLHIVFKAAKDSPTILSQLRSADVQFGFHMLDWARISSANKDAYLQMISTSGFTVSDDVAVCRTTCPLHTSTLLLFAYEHLLNHCSDAASFSYLISSCSPSELSQFCHDVALGKRLLISLEFPDKDKVQLATEFTRTLVTLPHFQQTLGWMILSNALSKWKASNIFEVTSQYCSMIASMHLSSYELEGLSAIWAAIPPSEQSVRYLSQLSPQFQEGFVPRVVIHWFCSHPNVMLQIILNMLPYPECKVFLKALTYVAQHPDEWSDFVGCLKCNSSFVDQLASSVLGEDAQVQRLCQDLLRSLPMSKPTVAHDIDHIDMDGWASFAST